MKSIKKLNQKLTIPHKIAVAYTFAHATKPLSPKMDFGYLTKCIHSVNSSLEKEKENSLNLNFNSFYMNSTKYGGKDKRESSTR